MRNRAALVLGLAILLPAPALAEGAVVYQGPNGLSVNCLDFKKLADGGWRAGPEATLRYPQSIGSFAGRVFYVDGLIVNGTDIAAFLESNCGVGAADNPVPQ